MLTTAHHLPTVLNDESPSIPVNSCAPAYMMILNWDFFVFLGGGAFSHSWGLDTPEAMNLIGKHGLGLGSASFPQAQNNKTRNP